MQGRRRRLHLTRQDSPADYQSIKRTHWSQLLNPVVLEFYIYRMVLSDFITGLQSLFLVKVQRLQICTPKQAHAGPHPKKKKKKKP